MRFLPLLLLLFALSACRKEVDDSSVPDSGVYIVNEGNFNFGNGDVSVYDPELQTISNGLFKTANGFAPGDVLQSIFVKDSLAYLVINNGQKIIVTYFPSFQFVRSISMPGASPRYFLPVNDSIAYVSELYAKKIWLVNYIAGNVVGQISVNGWTERMYKVGETVVVQQRTVSLQPGSVAAVLKINTLTNTVTHQLTFGKQNVNSVAVDKFNRIWLALDEDTASAQPASIACLASDLSVIKEFDFSGSNNHPSALACSADGESVIYYNRHLIRLHFSDVTLPNTPFIDCSGKNVYAVSVNPKNGEVYLSDALDYLQKSSIERYSATGVRLHSFNAGIISSNFYFHE